MNNDGVSSSIELQVMVVENTASGAGWAGASPGGNLVAPLPLQPAGGGMAANGSTNGGGMAAHHEDEANNNQSPDTRTLVIYNSPSHQHPPRGSSRPGSGNLATMYANMRGGSTAQQSSLSANMKVLNPPSPDYQPRSQSFGGSAHPLPPDVGPPMLIAAGGGPTGASEQHLSDHKTPTYPHTMHALGPGSKPMADPPAAPPATDADLAEVKWMAARIAGSLQQSGSQQQNIDRLQREVDRLRLENNSLKTELSVSKEEQRQLQEKLQYYDSLLQAEKVARQEEVQRERNERQNLNATMHSLRETWQSQSNAHVASANRAVQERAELKAKLDSAQSRISDLESVERTQQHQHQVRGGMKTQKTGDAMYLILEFFIPYPQSEYSVSIRLGGVWFRC